MRVQKVARSANAIICFSLSIFASAQGNSRAVHSKIPEIGTAAISAVSPKGKATVTIQTIVVEGDCQKACPTTRFLTETGAKRASVVQSLAISVAGEPIAVPPFVYSGLFNVQWASLNYKNGTFNLEINEGTDRYLIHIYFDTKNGISRMTVYDYMAAKLVENAHFYQAVLD